MTCENYTYLPGLEEASLEEYSSVTGQSAPSKLSHTAKTSCEQGSGTESCHSSQSLETSENLTGDSGEEKLTSLQEDSLAKTSVPQEKEQASLENAVACGQKWQESLERLDLNLSLLKRARCLGPEDLEPSSKTLPKWGMMQGGECWELGTLVRPIKETECGYLPADLKHLPTPDASKRGPTKTYDPKAKSQSGRTLQSFVASWPTPTRRDWKGANAKEGLTRKDGKSRMDQLPNAVAHPELRGGTKTRQKWVTPQSRDWKGPQGRSYKNESHDLPGQVKAEPASNGQLNPSWVEWLIGWPIEWTGLKPLEMDRFQQWRQQHSEFYPKDCFEQ